MTDTALNLLNLYTQLRPPWMKRAACRGVSTNNFYLPKGASLDGIRKICSSCPVQKECLDMFIDEPFGFVGNTSERQRRQLRRERRRNEESDLLTEKERGQHCIDTRNRD